MSYLLNFLHVYNSTKSFAEFYRGAVGAIDLANVQGDHMHVCMHPASESFTLSIYR